MELGYQGGIVREPRTTIAAGDAWTYPLGDQNLFLRVHDCARLFVWDALALLIRGYARPTSSTGRLDLEAAAEEARAHYLEYGDIAVDGLEGSFTLALIDGQAGRVLLYRNL